MKKKYLFLLSAVLLIILISCSKNIKSDGIVSFDSYSENNLYSIKTYYNGVVKFNKGNRYYKMFPDSNLIFNRNSTFTLKKGILFINKNKIVDIDISYKLFFNNMNGESQFLRIKLPKSLNIKYSDVKITYELDNKKQFINTKSNYLFKYGNYNYYGFFIPLNLFWNVKKYDIDINIGDYKSYNIIIKAEQSVKIKNWLRQTVYFNFKKSSEILKTDYKKFKIEKLERDAVYKINTPSNYFHNGFGYPLLWRQYLTSEYGLIRKWVFYNGNVYSTSIHNGLDFAYNRGTNIHAACDGIVRYAKYAQLYGNMVIIDHGNSVFSEYYHMDKLAVKTGDIVRRDELIGYMGTTGASTGYHLHWTLRINNLIINPLSLMNISDIFTP